MPLASAPATFCVMIVTAYTPIDGSTKFERIWMSSHFVWKIDALKRMRPPARSDRKPTSKVLIVSGSKLTSLRPVAVVTGSAPPALNPSE
jgi:hypothetical protein